MIKNKEIEKIKEIDSRFYKFIKSSIGYLSLWFVLFMIACNLILSGFIFIKLFDVDFAASVLKPIIAISLGVFGIFILFSLILILDKISKKLSIRKNESARKRKNR